MPDVSASDAARNLAALLDAVEQRGEQFTIRRRGRAVASLQPVARGRGRVVKDGLRAQPPDAEWAADIAATRRLLSVERCR